MRIVYVEGKLYEDVLVTKVRFLKAESRGVSNFSVLQWSHL